MNKLILMVFVTLIIVEDVILSHASLETGKPGTGTGTYDQCGGSRPNLDTDPDPGKNFTSKV